MFQVTAPVVVIQPGEGSKAGYRHIYNGGIVPPDADEEQLKMLVADGMVVKLDDQEPDGTEKPSNSASKAAWVSYAVEQGGMDLDDAEAMTRDQLREHFADQ